MAAAVAVILAWLPKPVPVDTARARRGSLSVTIDEDGRTRVKDRYRISAPLLGRVSRIEMEPGAIVEAGTMLTQLLPLSPTLLDTRQKAQAEAQVAAARAARKQALARIERIESALEFAAREAARQRQLLSQGATASRSVEQAELEVRNLREELSSAKFGAKVVSHELQMARAALGGTGSEGEVEHLTLRSPVDGIVLKVLQTSEGVVQPGTPLVEVGDPNALEVVVDVLTRDAVDVARGTPVRIQRWGGDHELAAHVRLIEPSAFTRVSALGVEEQRVNLVIDFDEPRMRWRALGDGYRVEARIVVWQSDDVLKIPSSAIFRRGEAWACFVVREGVARLARLQLGRQGEREVQVEQGLAVGDEVIVHPGDQVADGLAVERRGQGGPANGRPGTL